VLASGDGVRLQALFSSTIVSGETLLRSVILTKSQVLLEKTAHYCPEAVCCEKKHQYSQKLTTFYGKK